MAKRASPQAVTETRNLDLARRIAAICDEKRAEDLLIMDMRPVCDFTDFFVVATAESLPQMKAIARDVEKALKEERAHQLGRNGLDEGKWVLLDYGDVVLHLFDHETRDFYQLENLWGDAPKIKG